MDITLLKVSELKQIMQDIRGRIVFITREEETYL